MDDNESTVSRRDDAGGRISSEDTESLPRSSHSGEEENTTNHNNGWKENTTSPTMVAVEDGCESSPTSSSSSDSLPDGEFVPAKLANGSDNSLKTGYGESLETVPGYEGDYDDDVGTESVQSINMENGRRGERSMLAHSSMFPSGALPTYWRSSPAPRPALWCVRMLSGEENERVFEEDDPLLRKGETLSIRIFERSLRWWRMCLFFTGLLYTVLTLFFVVNRLVNYPFAWDFVFNTLGGPTGFPKVDGWRALWTGLMISFPLLPAVIYVWVYPVLGFFTQFVKYITSKVTKAEFDVRKTVCVSVQGWTMGLALVGGHLLLFGVLIGMYVGFTELMRSLDAGSTSLTVVQYLYPLLFAPTLLIVEDIVEYIIASALKRELRLYAEEYSQALLVHIGTMRIISHLLASTLLGLTPAGEIGYFAVLYPLLRFIQFEIKVWGTRVVSQQIAKVKENRGYADNNDALQSMGGIWRGLNSIVGYGVDSRESVGGSLFVMGNMIDMLMISQLSPISPIINTLSLVCENGMYYYRRERFGVFNTALPTYGLDNAAPFLIVTAGLLSGASNLGIAASVSAAVGTRWGLLLVNCCFGMVVGMSIMSLIDQKTRTMKLEKSMWIGVFVSFMFLGIDLIVYHNSHIFGQWLMLPTYFWGGGIAVLLWTWVIQLLITLCRR